MKTPSTFGRDAAAAHAGATIIDHVWMVVRWILFCIAAALVFTQLKLLYLAQKHGQVVIRSNTAMETPSMSSAQNNRFEIQEVPFATLYRRASTKVRSKGDISAWTIRGIARYGAPSFYLGVWESKRSRPLRYDIRKRVNGNSTLTDWGDVSISSAPEMLKTDFGDFELLRFDYNPQNPPSGPQSCAYFSSIDLPKAFYARGHYCVAAEKELDVGLIQRTLSSIKHVALPAKK